jgi:hypothetical protein
MSIFAGRQTDMLGIEKYEAWVDYENRKILKNPVDASWYETRKGWISKFRSEDSL